MLKAVSSSAADATGVTASSTLTSGRIPMGDGARGLSDTGAGTIGTSLAIAGATIGSNALAITGTFSFSGAGSIGGAITYTAAAAGPILKQGANGRCGTFVANGVTPVTINNTSIAITDAIIISLNTVGGTVGVQPHVATITASSGFTVVCTASDTSTYNYAIIKNAA